MMDDHETNNFVPNFKELVSIKCFHKTYENYLLSVHYIM